MKIIDSRGDLTDTSAKEEALIANMHISENLVYLNTTHTQPLYDFHICFIVAYSLHSCAAYLVKTIIIILEVCLSQRIYPLYAVLQRIVYYGVSYVLRLQETLARIHSS